MEISIFKGKKPHEMTFADGVVDLDWEGLQVAICSTVWSPGVYRQTIGGLHRLNSNLVKMDLLALDVDKGATISEVCDSIKSGGLKAIVGTTRNHNREKITSSGVILPACDRCRIIFPLETSIETDEDFKATWFNALKTFPYIDQSCKDSARFLYPCTSVFISFDGQPHPVFYASNQEKMVSTQSGDADRGRISVATLDFIANGANNGEWHHRFFRAAIDLKEQGYTRTEAREKLVKAATNLQKDLDKEDERQLSDVYEKRTPKYPPRLEPRLNFRIDPHAYSLMPLRDLLDEAEEEESWLVEKMLPTAGISVLCGKPKAGKTTLARCLARDVSSGGENFLGRVTQKGNVLYFALEEKKSEVKKHFRSMGVSGEEKLHLHISRAPQNALEELKPIVSAYKPVLIIIDPLFRFMRVPDANDYAKVSMAFEPIMQLARESKAHILLVHHLGKGGREGCDAILGSTAIFGAVDTALILKRGDKYRTLSSQQRYGEDLEETTLQFDAEKRIVTLGETKTKAEEERIGSEILNFLSSQKEPQTEKEIDESTEGATRLKRTSLRELLKQERIKRIGKGGKTDPYKYSIQFHVPDVLSNCEKQGEPNPPESLAPAGSACFDVPAYREEHENNNGPKDCDARITFELEEKRLSIMEEDL